VSDQLFPKPIRSPSEKRRLGMEYRQIARPQYLMDTARKQGRLLRRGEEIPGELPFEKLKHLEPGEWPLCEIGLAETNCHGRRTARSIHHLRGREGENMIDDSKFMACCSECHSLVESNRTWAYANGYLLRRNR
jgi:hypothetical protein